MRERRWEIIHGNLKRASGSLVEANDESLTVDAGAAVAMAIGAKTGDIDIRYSLLIPAGAVLGAGVGAGVGAMSGGPVTVYRN